MESNIMISLVFFGVLYGKCIHKLLHLSIDMLICYLFSQNASVRSSNIVWTESKYFIYSFYVYILIHIYYFSLVISRHFYFTSSLSFSSFSHKKGLCKYMYMSSLIWTHVSILEALYTYNIVRISGLPVKLYVHFLHTLNIDEMS